MPREFSLAEVSNAISLYTELQSDAPGVRELAGTLHQFVNGDPRFKQSGLTGAGIQSLILQNLSSTLKAEMDPAKLTKLQEDVAKHHAGHDDKLGRSFLQGRTESTSSGTRTSGSPSYAELRAIEAEKQMHEFAGAAGFGWAANNPELRALGLEGFKKAVELFKDTHYKEATFRAVKDAGGHVRDDISIARFAKETGVDANKLGDDVAKKIREAAPPNSPENKQLWQMTRTYMDAYHKTNTPEQNAKADKAFDDSARKLSGGEEKKFKEYEGVKDTFKAKQAKIDQQATVTTAKDVKADIKEAKVDDAAAKGADLLKKRLAAKATAAPTHG